MRTRGLAADILAHGGALVSEHAPGVPAHPAQFVRRNRIQSGLSCFSIVVESAAHGGAMHQTRFTAAQGRPLYGVLPSGPQLNDDFNPAGAHELICTLKARVLTGTHDLHAALAAPLA